MFEILKNVFAVIGVVCCLSSALIVLCVWVATTRDKSLNIDL